MSAKVAEEESSSSTNFTKKQENLVKLYNSISCSSGLESHKVETEDGYILGLFRLVGGEKVGESPPKHNIPGLFIAGLFNDGLEWLLLDEEKTLPNMLAKQGYDCWLGSLRGTKYSREHTSLKTSSKKFWNFCLDEQSKYDLPALIDYILKVTQQKDLFYIGFSMGGYLPLSMLCLRPDYSPKVRAIIGLAPGLHVSGDFKSTPLFRFGIPVTNQLSRWRFLVNRQIGGISCTSQVKKVIPSFTKINPESLGATYFKLLGKVTGCVIATNRTTERQGLNLLAQHMPSSTSFKHVAHIAQIFHAKELRMFDYGRDKNIKRYATTKPPLLDLSQVSVPVATFCSEFDRVIPTAGVLRALEDLPNLISHTIISSPNKFTHMDLLIGTEVHVLVYPKIVEILNKYSDTDKTTANAPDMNPS